jgi:hypothetical protein
MKLKDRLIKSLLGGLVIINRIYLIRVVLSSGIRFQFGIIKSIFTSNEY